MSMVLRPVILTTEVFHDFPQSPQATLDWHFKVGHSQFIPNHLAMWCYINNVTESVGSLDIQISEGSQFGFQYMKQLYVFSHQV